MTAGNGSRLVTDDWWLGDGGQRDLRRFCALLLCLPSALPLAAEDAI